MPNNMLSDAKIRKGIKEREGADKGFRLPDGGGLFLYITPTGAKIWRLRYFMGGKEQTKVIGPYPEFSLAEAREQRDKARAALVKGGNPKAVPADLALTSLEAVARRWHTRMLPTWDARYGARLWTNFTNEILSRRLPGASQTLGNTQIAAIDTKMVADALEPIEERGAILGAHIMRAKWEEIFAYGMSKGLCTSNPAAMVRKALKPYVSGASRSAVTTLEEARAILRQCDRTPAYPMTRMALRLLALTALRPGEACRGEWPELEDLDGSEPTWIIPQHKMKMRVEHAVPLSRQAVETIKVLRNFAGNRPYMLPALGKPDKHITVDAVSEFLVNAGYSEIQVPHGWRATFNTIMAERHREDVPVLDLMLAHKPKDKTGRAYNRAEHMPRRRELAQEWADMLMVDMMPPAELVRLPCR